MEKEENSLDYEYGADEFVPIDSEVIKEGQEVYCEDMILNFGNCSITSEEDRDKLFRHFETALNIDMTPEEIDRAINKENSQFRKEIDEWVASHIKDEVRWE